LVVKKDFLVESIGEEHFFFKNFGEGLGFFWDDNFDPFLKWFPLPEHDKKVVFTNLIKGLDLIKPLFNRDELNRFGVEEFGDSLARESVVVDNVVLDDFRVRHDFHIVVVVGVFPDHVNELLGGEFFLTDHLEECGYFGVLDGDVAFGCVLYWREGRLGLDIVAGGGHLDWVPAGHGRKRIFDGLSFLVQGKGVAAGGPETSQALLVGGLLVLGLFDAELGEEGFGEFFFLEGFLFGLLGREKGT
jgi:hypothetical protein